jgi:polysaccharide deacetylase family protein (PEP-CTERM system associated)
MTAAPALPTGVPLPSKMSVPLPSKMSAPLPSKMSVPLNALTVDVEDYFQVQAFFDAIPRSAWEDLPRRVEQNTERLLALFERAGVRGTFFTLGWVAERHPALVRRIVAGGHELASHGHWHFPVHTQRPEDFSADIVRAKALLEDAGGVAVAGYRAPTFSLGPRTPWAFAILAETGHRYSSSVYPVRHDLYGTPDAPRTPYRHGGTPLWEIPLTTLRLFSGNLPCSGGGWFRLLPYALYRAALRRCNAAQGSGVFYIHPWEIDPGQPRVAAPLRSRLRHYNNLSRTEPRLQRLLRDFAWDRLDRVFAGVLAA